MEYLPKEYTENFITPGIGDHRQDGLYIILVQILFLQTKYAHSNSLNSMYVVRQTHYPINIKFYFKLDLYKDEKITCKRYSLYVNNTVISDQVPLFHWDVQIYAITTLYLFSYTVFFIYESRKKNIKWGIEKPD